MALLVRLTLAESKQAEFEAYERAAAAIMAEYGGSITLAFRPDGEPGVEWHLVAFPNAAAFAAYRQDERIAGLKGQRDAVIIATDMTVGQVTLQPYTTEK